MAIGSPQSDKFSIGTSEVRIAPLNLALKQMPIHSLGALDDVTINISNESVVKNAGFPQRQVAAAITQNLVSVTATPSEYSRRNIQILAGEAPEAAVTDVASTLAAPATAGATSITVATGDGSKFTPGMLITLYPVGRPELLSIVKVSTVATDTITLATETPTLHAYAATVTQVFATFPIGKSLTKTNYFSMQVIQSEFSTGRPLPWNFWKASVSSGLELAMNATDFASTNLEISVLEPAASEYGTGGALEHVASLIAEYPIFMYSPGA